MTGLINFVIFVMLFVTACRSSAVPEEYYYDRDYNEYELEDDLQDRSSPEFLVEPQLLKARQGDSVVIPCQFKNNTPSDGAPYILIIKKAPTDFQEKEVLIFVDSVKVHRDRRYKLNDHNLEIARLRRKDAGTYICRIESHPPVEISHVLEVEYPPKIAGDASSLGERRLHKGDSVRLECEAEGNPAPTIKWSKQEGHLPSGAEEEEGLSLTLADVDRHVEGNYVCTADNGIGEPDSHVIPVIVEYPPEIITEKDMVRTNDGDVVELVCVVHARPTPRVEWTKDGSHLNLDSHIEEQQNGGHRNSIKITHITEEDFGEYICTAENKFGVVESTISLSGLPKPPHFTSSPNGGEENSYTLTWYTESYYPVTEYRLRYRKTKANESTDEPGEWIDMTYEVGDDLETKGLVHSMIRTLKDLEAATDYEARVQIKNQYMWGDDAEFSFSTRKEVAQPTKISGAQSAGLSSVLLYLFLFCLGI